MPIPYTEFNWMFPPRAKARIPFERNSPVMRMWRGFNDACAQFKINGTNAQVIVYPDRKIRLWSRHKDENNNPLPIANYDLPSNLGDQIRSFTPAGTFSIYNAELVHHKTTNVKNVLYFFDTLVFNNVHLLGVKYAERMKHFQHLPAIPLLEKSLNDSIFAAHNIQPQDWDVAWNSVLLSSYCEGLVLKRLGLTSCLQVGMKENNNDTWMCRIRKPTKNFCY